MRKAVMISDKITRVVKSNEVMYLPDQDIKRMIDDEFDGDFSGFGFWLNSDYDWEIILDELNRPILLPTVKKTS